MRISYLMALALCLLLAPTWSRQQPTLRKSDIFETDFEGPDALTGWSGSARFGSGFWSKQSLFIERSAKRAVGSAIARMITGVGEALCAPNDARASGSGKQPGRRPDWPRLRGVTACVDELDPSDVGRFKRLGINLLSVGLYQDARAEARRTNDMFAGVPPTKDNPLAPYKRTLEKLDAVLAQCEKQDMKVCLEAGRLYGMRDVDVLWQKVEGQDYSSDHLVQFWRAMAKRYRHNRSILMYEILGEPVWETGTGDIWRNELLPKSIAAIREVNPSIWILVEPGPWGLPWGFADMPVVKDERVVYGFHHYSPHNYTHNFPNIDAAGKFVFPKGKDELVYSGMLQEFDGSPRIYWDRARLRACFQPAIDFQKRHHVRLFIGEFSVNRWASGREKWLVDSIDLFEELGWDWSFWGLVGWNGWNPTYSSEATPLPNGKDGGADTECWRILKRAWVKNGAAKK